MASKVFLIGLMFSLLSLVYGRGFTAIDKRDPEFKRMLFRFRQQKRGVCVDVRESEHCEDMINLSPGHDYCKIHKDTMKKYCAKTCKFCVSECKDEYDPDFCKSVSKCGNFCEKNDKQLPEKYCKKTCKLCGESVKPPSPVEKECKDKIDRRLCKLALIRFKNPEPICSTSYMLDFCRKTCKKCDEESEIMSDVSELLDLLESP